MEVATFFILNFFFVKSFFFASATFSGSLIDPSSMELGSMVTVPNRFRLNPLLVLTISAAFMDLDPISRPARWVDFFSIIGGRPQKPCSYRKHRDLTPKESCVLSPSGRAFLL